MELTPLAADSMGVRSLALAIETEMRVIIVDPGASLAPRRAGHRPHPREYRALKRRSDAIQDWGDRADVVVLTHFHFDHYVPSFENWRYNWSSEARAERLYEGATVLGKHTEEDINYSQRKRGYYVDQLCEAVSETYRYADGERLEVGDVTIEFSEPVPHGPPETELGYVLMVAIEDGVERVVYTSDVQGPVVEESLDWILARDPDLVVADGSPTYLSEETFPESTRERARDHLAAIAARCPLVVDHHLLREREYDAYLAPVLAAADDAETAVRTVAEFRDESNRLLEARRAELHEADPVLEEFYDRLEADHYVGNPLP